MEVTIPMTESGQLDLLNVLSERLATADQALNAMLDPLNPAVDGNPNDNLLQDLYGYVSEAQRAIGGARGVLNTMEERDRSEVR